MIAWAGSAQSIANQVRALAERIPATVSYGDIKIQLLAATAELQSTISEPPGTVIDATKQGIVVACGSGQLRIEKLRLNRGKGLAMDCASALNGYGDIFCPGTKF